MLSRPDAPGESSAGAPAPRGKPPVLRRGSRGPWVEYLQRELLDRGFYDGLVDGLYGELTAYSVQELQRHFRLVPDGAAGPAVFDVLRTWPRGPVRRMVVKAWESLGCTWIRADRVGRPLLSAEPVDRGKASGAAGVAVVVLDLSLARLPVRASRVASAVRAALEPHGGGRGGQPPFVVLAAPPGPGGVAGPHSAPLPLRTVALVAKALNRPRRCPVILSVPLPHAARLWVARWEGYEVGRLTRAFSHVLVWLPAPPPASWDRVLACLKSYSRGMQRWMPPWRLLVGVDLAPWLLDPPGPDGRRRRRRLSHRQVVLLSWRLRMRRGPTSEPEEPPELRRYTHAEVDPLLRWAGWAGIGGVVLAGWDRADPQTTDVITTDLPET